MSWSPYYYWIIVPRGAPAPTIASVAPGFGPEAGGTAITVTGTGFDTVNPVTGTCGGAALTSIVVTNSTSLTAVVPAGIFGTADIVLTQASGNTGSSGVGLFHYYKQSNFAPLTAGSRTAASLISATGVASFTRADTSNANCATCQTTVAAIESGVGPNRPRIDDNGSVKGLLIEQRIVNQCPTGGARKINVGWIATAQGVQTPSAATGPDGAALGASQCNMNGTNQISNYQDFGSNVATRFTFSTWQRSVVSDDMMQSMFPSGGGLESLLVRSASTSWGRLVKAKGTNPTQYVVAVETYDTVASGGQTARPRNVYVDFMQLEPGDFATSAIDSSSLTKTVRPSEYLAWVMPTTDDRIRLYLRAYPEFSTALGIWTNVSTSGLDAVLQAYYLYYVDAGNYMFIKATDNKLYSRVANSAELVSTNPIAFGNGDDLEVLIESGGNLATVLKYRTNGGAWTDLVMSTFAGDATPSGNMTLCNDAFSTDGLPLVCRLRELRSYPVEIATGDL